MVLLYIFSLFVKLLTLFILLPSLLSTFIIIALNSNGFLVSIFLVLLLGLCLVPSSETYSSVSSFCLVLCVNFYVLRRSVIFPHLGEVTLCRDVQWGPAVQCPPPELYVLGVPLMWVAWALLPEWG